MKRFGKTATAGICLVGGLACTWAVLADDQTLPDNPYASIVARNVFGLVPPPPPPPPPDPAELNPPPKITPNGIMSIFGKWQVLFKVTPVNAPGQPPRDQGKDQSYMLAEGQSQDDIEVVKVDPNADKVGVVTFNNHGITQEIPLTPPNLTGPAPDAAPGGAAPGIPGRFGGPGRLNRPGMFGGRVMQPGGGFGGGFGAPSSAPMGMGGGATGVGGGASSQASNEQLTPEAQIIAMEANRAALEEKGNPAAILIPPTPLTQALHQQQMQGGGEGGPPAP